MPGSLLQYIGIAHSYSGLNHKSANLRKEFQQIQCHLIINICFDYYFQRGICNIMCNIVHFTFGKRYKRVINSEFFSEERKHGRKINLLVYYEQVIEGIRKK